MSTQESRPKLTRWRDERADERELHWECLVPAEWVQRPDSVQPTLGDILLARFEDADVSIRSELSASFVDREVAPPDWLAILTDERNERVVANPSALQESHLGILTTEYTLGDAVFRRTSRILRNGSWMLFATVTAPAEVHEEVARDAAAMLFSFHPLSPSETPPEILVQHTIEGPPSCTFEAPTTWTTPRGDIEVAEHATSSRTLTLQESDATLALLRVCTFVSSSTSPQRALAQLLAPMRDAGTTFVGSAIVPLGGDDRWSDRFFAEVGGRNGETALTGHFHFLNSDVGDVAVWTLSFSREVNPVVWAITKCAGEIAAANTTMIEVDDARST